jgi:serine/threonine-protein kinase
MDSKQWGRVQHIFHEVADRPPALQQELVEHLSAGDEAIAAEVLRMIEAEREGASLLESDLETAASELIHPEPDSIPSQSFGPYTLISLLGEGGMGVVYLAERSDLGSQAAVKILRDSALSPMRRQRFALEQRTLAHLNHPSIARLYDADTLEDGTPFIVMEYVAGIPLNKYVEQQALAIDAILRLFRSVCEAVRYAHAQAIIHRDLKPSNILATADGQVKLLDFGIAKHLETAQGSDPKTLTAFQFMTIIYAAPEQIKGGIASIQTDVYSLGVILYELLAGRLPYDLSNQSPAQAERLLETASAKPPSEFGLNASLTRRVSEASWRELDTICLTAMHKDQRRRYQSVEALIRDLDHYLKGEPLEAHPDSIGYRASRFFGRNRRALILSTALSLAALMYAVFFLVRLERARQATAAEAARTLQIQRFMLNLFNGGDNQTGPSEDLRVVTLLDRGVTQARTLDQDPETQAELYQTLAGIYVNLGKFDRADPLLQSALEKQKTLYGPQSPQVAETMSSLGLLRLDQAHPEDAEKLTRAALDIDRKLLTSGDPKLAKAMWALGHVLDERGAYDEAIPLLQQAVALQSKDPQAAADLAMSTAELATANSYTGHYQLADSLYRKSLAIDERIYGTGHPRVADDLISLGQIAHSLGSETQAEDYYRRGLAIKQSWYGEKHPDTAFAMMALAQSLIYQKRYDDAAPLSSAVSPSRKRSTANPTSASPWPITRSACLSCAAANTRPRSRTSPA